MPDDKIGIVDLNELDLDGFDNSEPVSNIPVQSLPGKRSQFDEGYVPTEGDINEYRARNQSTINKALRYTGQGVSTFGLTTLETLAAVPSLLYAAPKAAIDASQGKDTQFLEDWISNPVMKGLEDVNKWVQEEGLVGYETQQSEGLWESGTAFYRDLMNGLGFLASNLIPTGLVAGGVSKLGRVAANSSRATKMVSNLSKLKKGTNVSDIAASGQIQRVFNGMSTLTGASVARLGESAIEANGAVEKFVNGNPNATPEQIESIRQRVFAANMAMAIPDAMQFARIFGSPSAVIKGVMSGEKKVVQQISRGLDNFRYDKQAGRYLQKEMSKPRRIFKRVSGVATNAAQEALEEQYQFNVGEVADKMVDGDHSTFSVFPEVFKEMMGKYGDTTMSKEELRSMILGGILGGGMSGVGAIRDTGGTRKQQSEKIQKELDNIVYNLEEADATDRYRTMKLPNGEQVNVVNEDWLHRQNIFTSIQEQKKAIAAGEIVSQEITAENRRLLTKQVNENPQLEEEQKQSLVNEINNLYETQESRPLTENEKEEMIQKLDDLQLAMEVSVHQDAGTINEFIDGLEYMRDNNNEEELLDVTGATDPNTARDFVQSKINKARQLSNIYDKVENDYMFYNLEPSLRKHIFNNLVRQQTIQDVFTKNLAEIAVKDTQLATEVENKRQIRGQEEIDPTTVNPELYNEIEELREANRKLDAEDQYLKNEYREWRESKDQKAERVRLQREARLEREEQQARQAERIAIEEMQALREFSNGQSLQEGQEVLLPSYSQRRYYIEKREDGDYAVREDGKYANKITGEWIRKQNAKLLSGEQTQERNQLEEAHQNLLQRIEAMDDLRNLRITELTNVKDQIAQLQDRKADIMSRIPANPRKSKDGFFMDNKGNKIGKANGETFEQIVASLQQQVQQLDSTIESLQESSRLLNRNINLLKSYQEEYEKLSKDRFAGIPTLQESLEQVKQEAKKITLNIKELTDLQQENDEILENLRSEREVMKQVLDGYREALRQHIETNAYVQLVNDNPQDFPEVSQGWDGLSYKGKINRLSRKIWGDQNFSDRIVNDSRLNEYRENRDHLQRQVELTEQQVQDLSKRYSDLRKQNKEIAKQRSRSEKIDLFLENYDKLNEIIEKNLRKTRLKNALKETEKNNSDSNSSTQQVDESTDSWEEKASIETLVRTTGYDKTDRPPQLAWQKLTSRLGSTRQQEGKGKRLYEITKGYLKFHTIDSPVIEQTDKNFDDDGIWVTYHETPESDPWVDEDGTVAYTAVPAVKIKDGEKTINENLEPSTKILEKEIERRDIQEGTRQEKLKKARDLIIEDLVAFRGKIKNMISKGDVFHKADLITQGQLNIAERIQEGPRKNHHRRHHILQVMPSLQGKNVSQAAKEANIKVNTSFSREENQISFNTDSGTKTVSGLNIGGVYMFDPIANSVVQLRNRKLNNDEVFTVLSLINEYKDKKATDVHNFADNKSKVKPRYLHAKDGMINSMMLWGPAKKTNPIKKKEDAIFFAEGKLIFGDNYYSSEQIEQSLDNFMQNPDVDDPLVNFLKTRYHQVNQNLIQGPESKKLVSIPYAVKANNKKGYQVKRTITTYKEYLLLGRKGAEQGKIFTNEEGETDSPLSSNIIKYDPQKPFRKNRQFHMDIGRLTESPKTQESTPSDAVTTLNDLVSQTRKPQPEQTKKKDDPLGILSKKEEPKKEPSADPFAGLKKKQIIKREDKRKGTGYLSLLNTGKPIDLSRESTWFKKRFPKIDLKVTEKLIEGRAFGRFNNNLVEVYRYASQGTVYHEGFHVVTQLYLSDKKRENLYKEFMQRKDAIDRLDEMRETYGDADQVTLIEEALAEEFSEYVQSDGQIQIPKAQKNLFQKLLDWVRSFMGIKPETISELYSRIQNGTFETPVYQSQNSYNRLININTPQGVVNLNTEQSRKILDGFNYSFINNLLEDGTPLDISSGKIDVRELYDNTFETFLSFMDHAAENADNPKTKEFISNLSTLIDSEDFGKYFRAEIISHHQAYVQTLGFIEFSKDEDGNLLEYNPENYDEPASEKGRNNEAEKNPFYLSVKDKMSSAVRLFLASVPKGYNSFGLPEMVPFDQTFNFLANHLSDIPHDEDFVDRIRSLAPKMKGMNYIADKLESMGGENAQKFKTQFIQTFAKAKYNFLRTLAEYDEQGNLNIQLIDSTRQEQIDTITNRWREAVRANATLKDGVYTIPDEVMKKTGADFLEAVGIKLTNRNIDDTQEDMIRDIKSHLRKMQEDGKSVTDIFDLDQVGRINKLAEHEVEYNQDIIELQHFNLENRMQYGINLNSNLTLLAKKYSHYSGSENLTNVAPWLDTDPYIESSLWKQHLKEGGKIEIGIAEGSRRRETGDTGVSTDKMDEYDKLMTNMALVFKGHYPFMRSADRSVEYVFSTHKLLSRSYGETVDYLTDYLKDEINTIINYDPSQPISHYSESIKSGTEKGRPQGRSLRIFKDILPDSLREQVYKLTDDYSNINEEAFNSRLNNILEKAKNPIENFLSEEVNAIEQMNPDTSAFQENDFTDGPVSTYVQNHILAHFEQTKLFTGDPAYYKSYSDAFKRFSMDNSTKKISRIDHEYNEYLNELYQSSPRKDGKLADGIINSSTSADVEIPSNYTKMLRDIFKSELKDDRLVEEYLDAYNKMNEADAQSYGTLDEYREILMRSGDWTEKQQLVFDRVNNGEELSADELAYFPILKIQYSGSLKNDQGKLIPAKRKTSLMPLIPQVIKNTNLEQLNNKMRSQQIGIHFYESASKVGFRLKPDGTKAKFYGKDGSALLELEPEELYYEYMGIQLDMDPKVKTEVSQGTQFNVLKLSNTYQNGQPKAMHLAGKLNSDQQVQEKVIESIQLEAELTNRKWNEVTTEMGISKVDDSYEVTNPENFKEFLESKAKGQGLDENTIISLRSLVQPDGTVLEIDTISAKSKVENLIHAAINNEVIRKKRHGGSKPQVASTGFESGKREFTNDTLKFYRWNEDKTQILPMKVMIPLPKEWMSFAEGMGGLDKLNEIISNPELMQKRGIDPKALEIVGFRIPTQKMGSADHMQVVKFLPSEAGEMIVMPTEVVAKSGSDYDIDKMNLYLPHVSLTGEGAKLIESGETDISKMSDQQIHNRLMELESQFITSKENAFNLLAPITDFQLKELANEVRSKIEGSQVDNSTSIVSPRTNIRKMIDFLSGKQGVGITALHVTTHQMFQNAGIKLDDLSPVFLTTNSDSATEVSMSGSQSADGTLISETLSAFLNAYVDIAKDPYVYDLGATNQAANTMFHLIRTGVPIREIIGMINQPIIKSYLSYKGSDSSYRQTKLTKSDAIKKALLDADMDENMKLPLYDLNRDKVPKDNPGYSKWREQVETQIRSYQKFNDKETLWDNIGKKPDKKQQLRLLDQWLEYENQASSLQEVMKILNANTKGIGKSLMESSQIVEDNYNTINDSRFEGVINLISEDAYMSRYFQARLEGNLLSYSRQLAIKTKPVKQLREILTATFKDNPTMAVRGTEAASSEYITYVLQRYLNERYKPNGENLENNYKRLFTGKSLARRILEAKSHPELKENQLIKEFFLNLSREQGGEDKLKLFSNKLSQWSRNELSDAFREIKSVDGQLYRDLLFYNVIQSGLSNSPVNFLHIVPAEDYNTMLSQARIYYDKIENETQDFVEKFLLNNPRYVFKTEKKQFDNIMTGQIEWKPRLISPRFFVNEDQNSAFPFIKSYANIGTKDKPNIQTRIHSLLPKDNWWGPDKDTKFPTYSKDYQVVDGSPESIKAYTFDYSPPKSEKKSALNLKKNNPFENLRSTKTESPKRDSLDDPLGIIPKNSNDPFDRLSKLQLTNQQKGRIDSELNNKINEFLQTNGIRIAPVNRIMMDGRPVDAVAKADMLNRTIEVVEGLADQSTLPEEAAHFYIEMTLHTPETKEMLDRIIDYPIYQQVREEYKDVYQDDDQFRKEAAGKLISQHILSTPVDNSVDNSMVSLWKKIWNYIKGIFKGVSSKPVKDGLNEYERAAYRILENKVDVTNLNLTGELFQKAETTQQQIVNNIRERSQNIQKQDVDNKKLNKGVPKDPSGKTERYVTNDGKVIQNRVTDEQTRLFEKIVGKERADQINASENSKIARDTGTTLHNLMEGFINHLVKGTEKPPIPGILKGQDYNKLYEKATNLVSQIQHLQNTIDPKGKAEILTEQLLFDESKDIAGSTDIVAIFSNGSGSIYDFKFMELANDEVSILKEESFEAQMKQYKRMLKEIYGVDNFHQTRVLPVKVNYRTNKKDNNYTKTGDIQSLDVDKHFLRPIPLTGERTGDKDFDKVLDKILKVRDKLRGELKTKYGDETLRARLASLREAARAIQLDRDVSGLLKDAHILATDLEENMEQMSRDELLDKRNALDMYEQFRAVISEKLDLVPDEKREQVEKSFNFLSRKLKLIVDKADQLIKTDIIEWAQQFDIRGIQDPAKEVGKNVLTSSLTTISDFSHPVFRTFYRTIEIQQDKTRRERDKLIEEIKQFSDLTANDYQKIINPQTGNLITEFSKEFWDSYNKAIEQKNIKWIKDNFEFTNEAKDRFEKDRSKKLDQLKRAYPKDEEKQKTAIGNWDAKYNPALNSSWLSKGYSYLSPKKKDSNLSQEWKSLQQNPKLKAFYDFYTEKMSQFREYVPSGKFRKNFIPNIRRDMVESVMKNGLSSIGDMKDMLTDSLTVREEDGDFRVQIDPDTGQRVYKVPTLFIQQIKPGDKEYSIKAKSYDLAKSLFLFGEMAISHKNLSEVEDITNSMKHVVRNSDQILTTNMGKIIRDEAGNPVVGKGSDSAANLFDRLVNYRIYGQRMQDSFLGAKADKILMKAMNYMSIKTLAFNPVSAAAAAFGAGSSAYMMGAKGKFYNKKQMWNAHANMLKQKDKFSAAKSFFELSQDDHTMLKARSISVNKASKLFNTDTLMIGLRKADQFVEGTVLNAMMQNHTIRDGRIARIQEGEKSLWNLSKVDGDKFSIEGLSDEQFNQFRRKARKTLQYIRGNSSNEDFNLYRTNVLGRALGQFRSWMPRLVEERFKGARYDQDLESIEEGRYRIFFSELVNKYFLKNLGNLILDLGTFGLFKNPVNPERAKRLFDQYVAENPQIMNDFNSREEAFQDYLETRRAQMRAMATELRIIAVIAGSIVALRADWDDDDEPDINNYAFGKYVTRIFDRFDDEVSFYFKPQSFFDMVKSPVPVMGLARDTWNMVNNTGDEIRDTLFGENYDNDKTGWFYYGSRISPVNPFIRLEEIFGGDKE